jgi:type VI secretion system protein ImpK
MEKVVPQNAPAPAFVSPSLSARVEAARQSACPLLEAARPLLDALASMPVALDAQAVVLCRQWLEQELKLFGKVCEALKLNHEHVENARYCLCSALDEAVLRTAWGRERTANIDWSIQGLATTLGYDRQGGDRVYRIIDEAWSDPYGKEVLEVCLGILERGFQGRYRYEAGGEKRLQEVRDRIRQWLLASRPSTSRRIPEFRPAPIPPWQTSPGELAARLEHRHRFRWLAIACVAIVLAGIAGYGVYRYQAAHQMQQKAPPPIDVLARSLNNRLRDQITAGTVNLSENAAHTSLTLDFADMFVPGEASVNTWVAPLVAVAGQQAASLPVSVALTGYTDDTQPDRHAMIRLNQTLSGARAIEVMRILLSSGVPAERITVAGKGDAAPVASNDTVRGRTKNRRVELTFSALQVK